MVKYTDDNSEWNKNWSNRQEAHYIHWTRNEPINQIQLAFRNHWELFNQFMNSDYFSGGKRALEVGCGRGSLSAYFSDAGFYCYLVDSSEEVIEVAKNIFQQNKLKANFSVGDTYNLDFSDNSMDVVFSIGLFEHFEDIASPINEQVRVLDKGGLFIAYIVPEYKNNVQSQFGWINDVLKGYAAELLAQDSQSEKEEVFRSDRGSDRYLPIMEAAGLSNLGSCGAYPLPMISHSIDFPFSLMPETSEIALVEYLKKLLELNRSYPHPWMCEEGEGNAFVVWGYKV